MEPVHTAVLEPMLSPPSPQVIVTKKLPPLPPDAGDDGEDSDREGEGDDNGDSPVISGTKRKARRGKRAKKKKGGATGAADAVEANGSDPSEKENQNESPNGAVVVHDESNVRQNGNPLTPSGLSFTTATPAPSPPVGPSLVVSDTVLGGFFWFAQCSE